MDNLNELVVQSIREMIPSLQGESLDFLKNLVKENHVSTFLEIGSANARTAIEIAALDPSIQVTTIERDPKMIELARKNISDSAYKNQIQLIEADALEPDYSKLLDSYDLIFIDAAKSKYRNFFELYAPLLSQHGIIVSDNMFFHGLIFHPWTSKSRRTRSLMKKLGEYHEFLENQTDYQTEWIDLGDGIALTRRKKPAEQSVK